MAAIPFIDLPLDVLLLIIPYLSAHDFLSLCSTCHSLYDDPDFKFSPRYWSGLTRSTFRVPNQPVVQADGLRWMKLYRRMRTQSRIYAWGDNDGGCFGGTLVNATMGRELRVMRGRGRRYHIPVSYSTTPRPCLIGRVGVVSDLQCGGWMTVMLNSNGCLFVNGMISGLANQIPTFGDPKPLKYPQGLVSPDERYDARTAIRQVSTGRSHVLGLADCGRIWTWSNASLHALQVTFLTLDLQERSNSPALTRKGLVTTVVAGWDRSSAYVTGTGIVLWQVLSHADSVQPDHGDEAHGTVIVEESWTIPDTGYTQADKIRKARDDDDIALRVGEVRNWIVLDVFVVFVTDLGKVFACPIPLTEGHANLPRPMELSISSKGADSDAVDVQGSFRYFAVLLRTGEVLTSDTEKLQEAWYAHDTLQTPGSASIRFEQIPSLQRCNVISLAFGDWHFHALHADGTITSHGREPELKGALGLGDQHVNILRGMTATGLGAFYPDGLLLRECETTGRTVCFEQEKNSWLHHLAATRANGSFERFTALSDRTQVRAVMSEWVEQRLRNWDSRYAQVSSLAGGDNSDDDDGLPAYFALSVAAAGHHSGAIVLVNENMAKARKAVAQARFKALREAAEAAACDNAPNSISDAVLGAMRWFFGSPANGSLSSASTTLPSAEPCLYCAATNNLCLRGEPCPHCSANGRADECVYPEPSDWWLDTLPRLRLPDGEVLPGEDPISDWECPEFKTF